MSGARVEDGTTLVVRPGVRMPLGRALGAIALTLPVVVAAAVHSAVSDRLVPFLGIVLIGVIALDFGAAMLLARRSGITVTPTSLVHRSSTGLVRTIPRDRLSHGVSLVISDDLGVGAHRFVILVDDLGRAVLHLRTDRWPAAQVDRVLARLALPVERDNEVLNARLLRANYGPLLPWSKRHPRVAPAALATVAATVSFLAFALIRAAA